MIWNHALPCPRMITLSTTIAVTPELFERGRGRGRGYSTKTSVNAIPTGLLHACLHSREVAMARYTPALGKILGAPIFLDGERDTVFFAQPPARGPPNTVPYFYMREFEEDLGVLRLVALPPMTHDLFGISLVEFPGLRSVILPSEKNIRLSLGMGIGNFMTLDDPQREQEAFEAEFEECWLKGGGELGLEESGTPRIIWMSKAELYSKVENEKVILKS
jgi:hypothetical protein